MSRQPSGGLGATIAIAIVVPTFVVIAVECVSDAARTALKHEVHAQLREERCSADAGTSTDALPRPPRQP